MWLDRLAGGILLVRLVMLAGWLATRSLQNMSPLRILRGE